MKKLFIIFYIVFFTPLTVQSQQWTGPTSPIDPMWGSKGSSIMSEALRDNQDFQYQMQLQQQQRKMREMQEEMDALKSQQRRNSYDTFKTTDPLFR